ncbi:TolC family outer membrane protein [Erythrobacter sp.]|uniref:TolC family outer membrane protein n=1 Tax=Erythrobacter sp. TaxID=1042 RepID=UPI001B1EFFBA|nr:TolC family outer membrane protein [Erythrobacter sp.]MBO6528099.1 TolC family outer membrane protein [Erythrobacter sp.]MBO6530899.1 TolC family outer membrane protein [Erythrobacter sp.]
MPRGGFAKLLVLGTSAGALALAAPAHADTLQEALSQAYQNNPTLLAARANQRAVDENVPIQEAAGIPSVDGTATYTEFIKNSPNSFTAPDRTFRIGPSLTVPVYAGGAIRNAVKAAKERVSAGQADLRAIESSIFNQVVAAYMDVLRSEALVALSANQVEVLTVNLQATSDRFEIGDLTRTDVAQSQSRLALAQGDLRNAQATLINARETYIRLVGEAPTDLQAPPALPNLPENVEIAVDVALENNPDLIAEKERADAAGFDSEVAGSGRLPTVALFANAAYTDYFNTLAGGAGGIAQEETTANAGVQVSIPIFQGGLPAARQRQAQARETAALEQVIATEREVIAQVRAAWSSWQASLAVIESSQIAVEAAELSLEGVRAENSIGSRQILDVLNAEQELLSSRVQLVTARRNAYVAGFTLLAAMGRAEARDLGFVGEGLLYDPALNYERVRERIWDWDRDPEPTATATSTVDVPAPDASVPAEDETETVSGY